MPVYCPKSLYDDLRKAVEKLHSNIQHPLKKQAIGYVLSLFELQDEEPWSLNEELALKKKNARSPGLKRAWQKRLQKMAEEKQHES